MVGHEASHTLFGHNNKVNLSPQQIERFVKICGVLRGKALQEMVWQTQSISDDLLQLRDQLPDKFHTSFNRVIEAINDGTYDDLPGFTEDDLGIPACHVPRPFTAVLKQVELNGDSLPDNMDAFSLLQDDWKEKIENNNTIYKYLREARLLRPAEANREVWAFSR